MKRGLKKLLSFFPDFMQEFVEMIFAGAAEYHIKISKSGKQKYRSYTQLKKHQKNVRRFLTLVFLVAASVFAGILIQPIFFPQPAESEVYIPNGKGDILVGNVSRSQATVIFKTLDGANDNRPLATKSVVEFYEDQEYKNLARRINENEYAVTHIVPVDSLQEGKIYYIKITAEDSAIRPHVKTVSSWGNGNDPVKVFTTGDLIPNCASSNSSKSEVKPVDVVIQDDDEQAEKDAGIDDDEKAENLPHEIGTVQNENYIQPGNKVQTIISWTTNVPGTTSITYGEKGAQEKKKLVVSRELVTKHAAVLTTLKPGTVYYFSTESVDANGNIATSEEYSLRTPKAQENVIQKITNSFKGLLLQIKPR